MTMQADLKNILLCFLLLGIGLNCRKSHSAKQTKNKRVPGDSRYRHFDQSGNSYYRTHNQHHRWEAYDDETVSERGSGHGHGHNTHSGSGIAPDYTESETGSNIYYDVSGYVPTHHIDIAVTGVKNKAKPDQPRDSLEPYQKRLKKGESQADLSHGDLSDGRQKIEQYQHRSVNTESGNSQSTESSQVSGESAQLVNEMVADEELTYSEGQEVNWALRFFFYDKNKPEDPLSECTGVLIANRFALAMARCFYRYDKHFNVLYVIKPVMMVIGKQGAVIEQPVIHVNLVPSPDDAADYFNVKIRHKDPEKAMPIPDLALIQLRSHWWLSNTYIIELNSKTDGKKDEADPLGLFKPEKQQQQETPGQFLFSGENTKKPPTKREAKEGQTTMPTQQTTPSLLSQGNQTTTPAQSSVKVEDIARKMKAKLFKKKVSVAIEPARLPSIKMAWFPEPGLVNSFNNWSCSVVGFGCNCKPVSQLERNCDEFRCMNKQVMSMRRVDLLALRSCVINYKWTNHMNIFWDYAERGMICIHQLQKAKIKFMGDWRIRYAVRSEKQKKAELKALPEVGGALACNGIFCGFVYSRRFDYDPQTVLRNKNINNVAVVRISYYIPWIVRHVQKTMRYDIEQAGKKGQAWLYHPDDYKLSFACCHRYSRRPTCYPCP